MSSSSSSSTNAVLQSVEIPPGSFCLSFWYKASTSNGVQEIGISTGSGPRKSASIGTAATLGNWVEVVVEIDTNETSTVK